jgi:uncharacterized membrane protein
MIHPRISTGFAALVLGASLAVVQPIAAQAPQPVEARQGQSSQAATVTTNAEETRRMFYSVLDQYPPALGHVLRLDPTLLANPTYLASYPGVATFVTEYPDIPRNPGYYLERYGTDRSYGSRMLDPKMQSLAMWNEALEFLGAFAVFAAVMFALFGFIKYVVEYRRWQRITKMNSEVHNKILDRFGSNEELLAYIDSPPGRRFLEATPIAQTAAPARSVGAPFGRILLSVQVGIILLALGVGFLVISGRAIEEVQPVLTSLAVLGFCLGVGAIASAGASYALSRKLGLLQDEAAPRPQTLG